jgi:hypothetical protein
VRPSNIYWFGETEPLSGTVKCECWWCGRVFVVWRSRFLRGAKYCSKQCFVEEQREASRLIRSMHSLRVVSSAEELPELVGEYFRDRLGEGSAVLANDSSKLAEALIEILELIVGESEMAGWRPPALEDAHSRIGESL